MTIGPYEEYETLVDDEDVHLFEEFYWTFDDRYVKRKQNGKRNGPDLPRDPAKVFYLHREIMKPGEGMHIDHIDGNPLNNSRSNLRVCTQTDNNKNVDGVGVSWNSRINKWTARITHNYKGIHIGSFDTFEEASKAFKANSNKLRGEFSRYRDDY
jgi:hypothetical protein